MPANVDPLATPGSARQSSPKLRVSQIEPSFFGKPWIQPRISAKSLIHPDVGAARDQLAVEQRVDDDEELAVLRAARVEQLGAAVAAALPVDEQRRGAARVLGERLEALGQHGGHRVRIRPVLDHQEIARRSATAARGTSDAVPWGESGSEYPCGMRASGLR